MQSLQFIAAITANREFQALLSKLSGPRKPTQGSGNAHAGSAFGGSNPSLATHEKPLRNQGFFAFRKELVFQLLWSAIPHSLWFLFAVLDLFISISEPKSMQWEQQQTPLREPDPNRLNLMQIDGEKSANVTPRAKEHAMRTLAHPCYLLANLLAFCIEASAPAPTRNGGNTQGRKLPLVVGS